MNLSQITKIAALVIISCAPLLAQTADTPIAEQNGAAIKKAHKEIIDKALAIRGKVKAISKAEIDKQLLAPVPEHINLLQPLTKEMSTELVAEHARKSNLRVGYCYKCMSCDDWHINLAGGYAIAPNVIATCDHVLVTKTKMRDGFIVAFDAEGNVACGVAVLARSATMDAAIIKMAGADFTPVPLNFNIKQGSASYCFSYPLSQEGYFSTGIVNRFFWDKTYAGQDKKSIDALCHLRINYSNDWAPGSSGSPLFDSAGNVTGHVSTITALGSRKGQSSMLTLHTGIPARSVHQLAALLNNPSEITRLANIKKAPETKAPDKTPAKAETP